MYWIYRLYNVYIPNTLCSLIKAETAGVENIPNCPIISLLT